MHKKKLKNILLVGLLLLTQTVYSQTAGVAFNNAFKDFIKDPDFRYASIGLQVYDSRSGKTITAHNVNTGLAPASTQKIITAAAAYELLGADFRYETKIGYTGTITDGVLNGDLIIRASGDPTLGSWRFEQTKEDRLIKEIIDAARQAGITSLNGSVYIDGDFFDSEAIPDGWIWQDIGNYYGAAARSFNWRENQFDLYLKSGGSIGSAVDIAGTKPPRIVGLELVSKLKAAAAGTGDNAYIYLPMFGSPGYVRGTIPVNQNRFTISGTLPEPSAQFAIMLESEMKKKSFEEIEQQYTPKRGSLKQNVEYFHTISSPSMDSICYWFLQKSINLYGEALLKTMGKRLGKEGSTEEGVRVLKDFWKKQGIDAGALKMIDGSGLSPQNRITPDNLVQVLLYAQKQPWFRSYFAGFPTINGIRMKSGTIGGVVSYTGLVSSKQGDFVFAFIVNNHNGSASQTRRKMWRLLDTLK